MKTLKPTLFFIFSIAFAISQAQIVHVPGDYPTIQEGIDAAQFFGDTVLVEQGTYYENISFEGKLITVASNFILSGDSSDLYNTIIDGSLPANPDLGSVVYFNNDEDTNSVISGFTIQGGTGTHADVVDVIGGGGIYVEYCGAKITHNRIINNNIDTDLVGSGGGIGIGDIYNTSYVVIRHNVIANNSVESSLFAEGGGVVAYCNLIFQHNIVTNNELSSESENAVGGGARFVCGLSTPNYLNCTHNIISHNVVQSGSKIVRGGAGGMQAYNCWGYISNNKIQYNEISDDIGPLAGGLHLAYCGTFMIVENNLITYNEANYDMPGGIGGGIVMYTSNAQLINNVIAYNYAANGSGVQINTNQDGPAQFINNTIANNEGDGLGGAIYIKNATAVVLNSILWQNGSSGDEIYLEDATIEVAYSDVDGGWPGLGNIDEDPVFEDDSCHLNCIAPSPCIDEGLADFDFGTVHCYAPETDFEGEERPMDVTYDIGADESKICTGVEELNDSDIELLEVYPNPNSGAAHLRYSILDTRYLILEVYSADGIKVKNLFTGKQQAGEHEMHFNLRNLPNGIYVLMLQAGERVETTKVILLK